MNNEKGGQKSRTFRLSRAVAVQPVEGLEVKDEGWDGARPPPRGTVQP